MSAPRRVLVIGAYDPSTPRARQWFRLLEQAGAEVEAHPTTVWEGDRVEASSGSPVTVAWSLVRGLLGAVWFLARCPRPDVIVFCYPGHVDACVLGLVARLRGIPTVLDAFISLYDTVVSDRGLRRPWSPVGVALRLLDTLACWSVRVVVCDTPQHADFFAGLTHRARDRFAVLWVGADEAIYTPAPDPGDDGPILWYLTFIPLHGIETVLRAAALMGDDPRRFRLIGSGQARPAAEALIAELGLTNVELADPVPEAELTGEIARASVCLGAFGTSAKTARVVPNKVFQCTAAARPVVTADTPALRGAYGDALTLVPPGDPAALAAALRDLRGDARRAVAAAGRTVFAEHFSDAALVGDLVAVLDRAGAR